MNWIRQHFRQIIYVSFIFPILLVAFVSIAHVTKWYGIGNPISWSIYLSAAVEIAALSSLAAIVGKMGRNVYFPFILVTIIQFIGNIFYSYQYIQITSQDFKDWVDLVSPLVTFMGIEPTDMVGHKRLASFLLGGLLPVISLSFLGLLVKFEEKEGEIKDNAPEQPTIPNTETPVDAKDLMAEVSRVRLTNDELDKLEEMLKKRTPRPPSFVNDPIIPDGEYIDSHTGDGMSGKSGPTPEVKLPDAPKDIFLGRRNNDPVEINVLPPPAEEKQERIPSLSEQEIMLTNLEDHERNFDTNSNDYEMLSNITPKPEPIVEPQPVEDPIPDMSSPTPQFNTGIPVDEYYKGEWEPIAGPEVGLVTENSIDDIPPEVVDYKPHQTEEVKKK